MLAPQYPSQQVLEIELIVTEVIPFAEAHRTNMFFNMVYPTSPLINQKDLLSNGGGN